MVFKLRKNVFHTLSVTKRLLFNNFKVTSMYSQRYVNNARLKNQTSFTMPASLMFRTYGCRQCNIPSKIDKRDTLLYRVKRTFKEYWIVTLPVHVVCSMAWLSLCYYVTEHADFNIIRILRKLRVPEQLIQMTINSSMGTFTVVVSLYKILTPFRFATTYVSTVVIVRYLTERGYLDPPPTGSILSKTKNFKLKRK